MCIGRRPGKIRIGAVAEKEVMARGGGATIVIDHRKGDRMNAGVMEVKRKIIPRQGGWSKCPPVYRPGITGHQRREKWIRLHQQHLVPAPVGRSSKGSRRLTKRDRYCNFIGTYAGSDCQGNVI